MTKKLKHIIESIASKHGDKLYKNLTEINANHNQSFNINKNSDER